MKPTETVAVRKIDLTSHRDEIASEQAAVETPVTIYVNAEPVATLVATPGFDKGTHLLWTSHGKEDADHSLLLCKRTENERMLWA